MSSSENPVNGSYVRTPIHGLDQIDYTQIRETWILPHSVIRKLHCYYLLYWRKDYLENAGGLKPNVVISHRGLKYITVLTRPIDAFKSCTRVAVSFRHPFRHNFGYVLIGPAVKYPSETGGYCEN